MDKDSIKLDQSNNQPEDRVLVVEGGAMRGVFSAGVLDTFMHQDFDPFNAYYGVSAGSTNLASFLTRKPGRNFKITQQYVNHKRFMNVKRFLLGGNLLDLDWLWCETLREFPLQPEKVEQANGPFYTTVCDLNSGQAIYKQTNGGDLAHDIKASSALPVLYRTPIFVNGVQVSDGGLADALPVQQAINNGAKKIMVIRSRPFAYEKKSGLSDVLLEKFYAKTPQLKRTVRQRVAKYNQTLQLIRNPPQGIKIIEICPPDNFAPARLKASAEQLQEGYDMGMNCAKQAMAQWHKLQDET